MHARAWSFWFLVVLAALATPAASPADDEGVAAVFDDSVVGEVHATMDLADLDRLLDPAHAEDNVYLPAQVRFRNQHLDERFDGAGIRLRGNYSRHAAKKGFKISLDEFDPGADLEGLERINLVGEHNDPCIVREKLAIDALTAAGVPVSRASHVRFYLNGEYRGLYIHVEQVDERFLRRRFGSDEGNLYKCQYVNTRARADLVYRPGGDYEELGEPGKRVYELETERGETSFDDLAELIDVINNTPSSSYIAELERVLDVAGFVKAMAFDVLAGNWDSYWGGGNNFYLFNDPLLGRFRFIPRDFDMTFGLNSINSQDYSQINIYRFGRLDDRLPLVYHVFEHEQYRNLFTHFIEEFLDGPLAPATFRERAEGLRQIIRPAALEDTYRTRDFPFIDYEAFDRAFDEPLGGHVRQGLKPFMAARAASARDQIRYRSSVPALWAVRPLAEILAPREPVWFMAHAFDEDGPDGLQVTLHLDAGQGFEPHPMHDDGAHGDGEAGDGEYGGSAPGGAAGAHLRAYVEAEDGDRDVNRRPADAPSSTYELLVLSDGPLILNECMARNQSTIRDERGEFDDWIELWNRGPEAVNLAGYRLTDDPLDDEGWPLPDLLLAAGVHLLIWADDDPEQGDHHAPFRLDGDGEWIGLFEVGGQGARTLVDAVAFGPQEPDASFGRARDGDPQWLRVFPTPGDPNFPMAILPDELPGDPGHGATPPALALLGAWPNPLNRDALIRFDLAVASRLVLDVVDASGRTRRQLVNGRVLPGVHAVAWDGLDADRRPMPAGVYFLRLTAGSERRVTRVTVVH